MFSKCGVLPRTTSPEGVTIWTGCGLKLSAGQTWGQWRSTRRSSGRSRPGFLCCRSKAGSWCRLWWCLAGRKASSTGPPGRAAGWRHSLAGRTACKVGVSVERCSHGLTLGYTWCQIRPWTAERQRISRASWTSSRHWQRILCFVRPAKHAMELLPYGSRRNSQTQN